MSFWRSAARSGVSAGACSLDCRGACTGTGGGGSGTGCGGSGTGCGGTGTATAVTSADVDASARLSMVSAGTGDSCFTARSPAMSWVAVRPTRAATPSSLRAELGPATYRTCAYWPAAIEPCQPSRAARSRRGFGGRARPRPRPAARHQTLARTPGQAAGDFCRHAHLRPARPTDPVRARAHELPSIDDPQPRSPRPPRRPGRCASSGSRTDPGRGARAGRPSQSR